MLCQCKKSTSVITKTNCTSKTDLEVAQLKSKEQNEKNQEEVETFKSNSSDSNSWKCLPIDIPYDEGIKPIPNIPIDIAYDEGIKPITNIPIDIECISNIWDACEKGMFDEVNEFLSKDPTLLMKLKPDTNRTPLYYASLCGNIEIMELLINKGAKDIDGFCYHVASSKDARRLLLNREVSFRTDRSQDGNQVSDITRSSGLLCCGFQLIQ